MGVCRSLLCKLLCKSTFGCITMTRVMASKNTIQATAKVVIDTRANSQNKEGEFPLCIRVIHERQNRMYSIGEYVSLQQFEDLEGGRQTKDIKAVRVWANTELERANEIVEALGDDFTFSRFKEEFKNQKATKPTDVYGFFELYIDDLKAENRHSTAMAYQTALNSLKSFRRTKLSFKELDARFLRDYGTWFLKGGDRSESSLGIYLRSLKAVVNQAIDEGIVKKEAYPFGKGKNKYSIPTSRNIKKALNLADIKKIFGYEPVNEAEKRARDLWLFSYLCSGMNMKDMAELRYENIGDKGITFVRAKTKRSSLEEIFVPLLDEAKAIIDRWGNPNRNPNQLVFDLVQDGLEGEWKVKKRKQAVKTINKYMRRIASNLNLEKEVTTYTARHSFATVLKRNGASIERISEALGHKDVKTTEHYLDSFESEEKLKLQKSLVDFE